MEWFVEAVVGIEQFRKDCPSAPPLTSNNIQIDASSTILIDPPSSHQQPSIAGSFSSDISTLCRFFLDIHRTLAPLNRLTAPLHPDQEDIVFARIMIALVELFVASGDLILPNSPPKDHLQYYFADYFHQCINSGIPPSCLFFAPFLVEAFSSTVLGSNVRHDFVPVQQSFLNGEKVGYFEQLLDAVKKVKETHSLEAVRNTYFDWKEWLTMMAMVDSDVRSLNDLSFLQSRCFRRTLLSLQTKHQLRATASQTGENNETDSTPFWMPDNLSLHSRAISAFTDLTLNRHSSLAHQTSSILSSDHSSIISTQASLPSQHSSSESQTLASLQMPYHSDSIAKHSRQLLIAIHDLLARHPHISFPWDIRPSFKPESEMDALVIHIHEPDDEYEMVDVSLFDETDDQKIVRSLGRCRAIVKARKSADCIADIITFRKTLLSGLHSSNRIIQSECYNLFFEIGDVLQIVDDPRNSDIQILKKAFPDGSIYERMALLRLWLRWLTCKDRDRRGQTMEESDFNFDGFLAAEMSDIQLFDQACVFLERIFFCEAVSMPVQKRLDVVLRFERRNQMMSRLASYTTLVSDEKQSQHFQSPLAIILGSVLSVFCGCDFPSPLTELLAIDLESSPHQFSRVLNPAFFLNHTSIAPKHRRSFFPMDLVFERYLRHKPDTLLKFWSAPNLGTSRKFLHTPFVGLHALLHRSPTLKLDQDSHENLMRMLFTDANQGVAQADIHELFELFPPPRLLDILLSSPHLIRSRSDIYHVFLIFFSTFGVFTSPFGACSSLAKVFKMLSPFDQNPEEKELNRLNIVGVIVVSLHRLSIPLGFDSPLLCHLPSLAGAQRGVVQTLSSHFGIPSLVTPPNTKSDWDRIITMLSSKPTFHMVVYILGLCVRTLGYDGVTSSTQSVFMDRMIERVLLFRVPALASIAFEFFHRFVSVSSDAVRMELVKRGLLDDVIFAVSNSSFLDDYEKGIAVIGILLATIRRDLQTRKMRLFDFSHPF
ncbi:hypothetical protein BLNAU_1619 [Blattamonas nauphoetae]|uniref:Uncharacterized protein n=1 Tax=Blattamonas nauphoetae TaxID=2049346 RepID=A0ABQ9YIT3_9EUKA|nr:hypothetical protein BLNAU_1619 [Blattamonas nauphoetae]